jgi:hypothetical protein
MSQWQTIQSAPTDGTHIWGIAIGQRLPTLIAYNVWEGCWANHPAPHTDEHPVRPVVIQPTHWMPLPDPPTVEPNSSNDAWHFPGRHP